MYLALHGTYGLLWITKSRIFPDKQWEEKCSIFYGLFIWFGLSLYWFSPYIIVAQIKTLSFDFKIFSNTTLYVCFCLILYIYNFYVRDIRYTIIFPACLLQSICSGHEPQAQNAARYWQQNVKSNGSQWSGCSLLQPPRGIASKNM